MSAQSDAAAMAAQYSKQTGVPYTYTQNSDGSFSVGPQYTNAAGDQALASPALAATGGGSSGGQSNSDLMSAIQKLISNTSNVATPTIPSLGYTAPTGGDIDSKWTEFLNRAAQDPDIVNYYQKLLAQAQGDTNIAIGFIEKDYQTGTRQIQDTLKATLTSLGLTSQGESNTLADTLNKRGIALTVNPQGNVEYAGGGQPATEVANLGESQKLRKEAEIRSSSQGIESLKNTREKNITSQGQALEQTAQTLGKQEQQDILSRAQLYNTTWEDQQKAEAQDKVNKQASSMASGTTGNSQYGGYADKNASFFSIFTLKLTFDKSAFNDG